jgi:hypothetical protein
MFDELVQFNPDAEQFVSLESASVTEIIDAQLNTASWLDELGAPSDEQVQSVVEKESAREAFKAITFDSSSEKQKATLTTVKTPQAVRHLVGMLSAYDWDFVAQAKELRSYAVAKILEETNNPNANVRLKALQMLGNVTEVALFTERVEVAHKNASEAEVEARLRERLARFITPTPVEEVVDVPVLDQQATVVDTDA